MRKPDISGLKDALADAARWVETGLAGLSMRREPLSRLPSLAAYSLESGGKRVRPFLVSAACRAVGGRRDVSLRAACAVEMIHTYSLVHDDLPAMDDDSLRRGVPTLHMKCGEAQALLAGDLLLVEAFGELLETPLGPGRVSEMVRRLAAAAGPRFLVGGQYMDMYHPEDAGEDWIRRMILGKTAAMIRVSLELGALAGGAGEDMLERISSLGDRLGFLFQLTDDILDRCGSRKEMGKEVCKDREQGKRNLLSIMDVASASARARKMGDDIALDIMELNGNWNDVAALAEYLPVRRK
ncbi:MAG: polyprenyl synthetase family protein [Candidatus Aegiribacteria sp.]